MSKEHQNIEWKETWRDEYLKWISGFANAQGGVLYVGMNNTGIVVGLDNVDQLLESIPNKVRDVLGIMVEVNLKSEDGKDYLEIVTEPYPYPINYKGEYHYRSGSTKQELKGAALNKFLLQKTGNHWDSIPLPNLRIEELDDNAFKLFKKYALRSKRVDERILEEKNEHVLDNLHLKEHHQLKRSVALLFYHDPEKYISGAFIKIGYFESAHDLRYQDVITGNLFEQIEKTMELLYTKYMSATISYEGITRVEEFPYPQAAVREALLNAVAHKDYSSGNPIQIKVFKSKLQMWNEGQLPQDWTLDTFLNNHPSKPANPDVANTLFRAGLIESWGRGISKIITECDKAGVPVPKFTTEFGGISVEFSMDEVKTTRKSSVKSSVKILTLIIENENITIPEIAETINLTTRAVEKQLSSLQKQGIVERIGPDKGGYWMVVKKPTAASPDGLD